MVVVDSIPLSEIDDVMEMNDEPIQANKYSKKGSLRLTPSKTDYAEIPDSCNKDEETAGGGKKFLVQAQSNILQIKTAIDGYNSGKTYYLSTRHTANPDLNRQIIISQLDVKVKAARRKAEAKSRFQKTQEQVQAVQGSLSFQLTMAVFIMVVILPDAFGSLH
jgi:hypothetical protein